MWMMVKRYRVQLAEEEQQELMALVSKGRGAAYRQTHARILLLYDENQADGAMKDEEIGRALKGGHHHGGAGAPPVRGGESGSSPGPQATTQPASEEAGWCRGGSPDSWGWIGLQMVALTSLNIALVRALLVLIRSGLGWRVRLCASC